MKRTLALIMLVLMLAVSLAACNDPSDTSKTDASDTSVDELVADVPDVDYNGKEIIFLTAGVNQTANSEIVYNEYGADDENQMAAVVNDALRERMNVVAEQIGVTITEQYIYDGKRYSTFPAVRVDKTVDTTAAGDAFTAALTLEYLRCGDIKEAIKYANVAGALTVSRAGASVSVPTEEEVRGLISSGG